MAVIVPRRLIRSDETEPDSWCGCFAVAVAPQDLRKSPGRMQGARPRGDNERRAGVGRARRRTRPALQGAWLALRVVPMTPEGVGSYIKSKSVWVRDTPFSTVANTTAFVPPLPSSS